MIFDASTSLTARQIGLTSKGGRSRPFDAQADGYARCEACSVAALGAPRGEGGATQVVSASPAAAQAEEEENWDAEHLGF